VEKQRETRYPTCEAVEVCILEMVSRHLNAVLREVSRNGLRLEVSMPVNAGARLEIVWRNRAIIFGEACYCRYSLGTYHVGVAIEDIYYPKPVSVTNICDGNGSPGYWHPNQGQIWIGGDISSDLQEPRGRDRDDAPTARFLGCHVGRNEVDSFLCHNLSETKTALVERHLASCEQCSDLMLLSLEGNASHVTRSCNTVEDDRILD
jgi:hypothetical protein